MQSELVRKLILAQWKSSVAFFWLQQPMCIGHLKKDQKDENSVGANLL